MPRAVSSIKDLATVVALVRGATPLQLVDLERQGVSSLLLKRLAAALGVTAMRLYEMVGVPKATAERKIAHAETLDGAAGRAAIALVELIALSQDLVRDSTAEEAVGFDATRWLGAWLGAPQGALGGRSPGEFIDTATGQAVVRRLLGALQSGAYQ